MKPINYTKGDKTFEVSTKVIREGVAYMGPDILVTARDIEHAKQHGGGLPVDVKDRIEEMRADYEHQLDARYAGARGYIDAIVYPEETRDVLAMALRAAQQNRGPHLGPFVLSEHVE